MKNRHITHPSVVIHGPFRGVPPMRRFWRSFDWRIPVAMCFGGFWGFAFGYLAGVVG